MDDVICRFCLCKIEENSIFLQKNDNFSQKVEEIFHKIEFKVPENSEVPICTYCHDFINKFSIYYEFVKQNQLKFVDTSSETSTIEQNEVVFEEIESETPKLEQNEIILEEYEVQEPTPEPIDSNLHEKLQMCTHCYAFLSSNEKILNTHVKKCLIKKKSYRRVPAKNELKIACPLCPTWVLNEKVLKLHLAEHNRYEVSSKNRVRNYKSALLACIKCERRFVSEKELEIHVENHEKKAFMTCELCGKTIIAVSLGCHLQNHFKKYVCEYCSLACKSKHDLQKHIDRKHKNPVSFKCALCTYQAKRKCFLENHVKHCRGPNTIPPCPHCEERFETENERNQHMRQTHRGFSCRMCAVQLENVSQYNRHLATFEHKQRSLAKKLNQRRKNIAKTPEIIEVLD